MLRPRSTTLTMCLAGLLVVGGCGTATNGQGAVGGPGSTAVIPSGSAPGRTPEPGLTSPVPTVALDDRHADPALEGRLPEVIGGVALLRESQLGTQLTRKSDAFDAFLAAVGGDLEGFSLASAYSPGGDVRAQVGAWRVRGADHAKLRDAFVAALDASSATPLDVADLTLAGLPVTRIGSEGQLAQGPMYAWVDGDTILFVQTPDPTLAQEALAKLGGLAASPGA